MDGLYQLAAVLACARLQTEGRRLLGGLQAELGCDRRLD